VTYVQVLRGGWEESGGGRGEGEGWRASRSDVDEGRPCPACSQPPVTLNNDYRAPNRCTFQMFYGQGHELLGFSQMIYWGQHEFPGFSKWFTGSPGLRVPFIIPSHHRPIAHAAHSHPHARHVTGPPPPPPPPRTAGQRPAARQGQCPARCPRPLAPQWHTLRRCGSCGARDRGPRQLGPFGRPTGRLAAAAAATASCSRCLRACRLASKSRST
jgi:hypothetical protein